MLTEARLPRPHCHRLAAGLLARAGFVVGAVASHRFGEEVLAAAVRGGAPILGMLHEAFRWGFVPWSRRRRGRLCGSRSLERTAGYGRARTRPIGCLARCRPLCW